MAKRLLDRQVSVVEYMTSGAAIFGDGCNLSPALHGIDRGLLRLEARFSYAKRMEKVAAVFPRTFRLLGNGEAAIVRAFIETCPPTTISRLENARQFHRFLVSRWMLAAPDPPYICDVAACELACADVDADVVDRTSPIGSGAQDVRPRAVRRSPAVVLLRCAYDVRPIFEAGLEHPAPIRRETPLVIVVPPGADGPQVFEVIAPLFDVLAALDDWTDPRELNTAPEFVDFLADLSAQGLIEVRR
jgi:hypothetical protein